jgi:uncharacterized protein
MSTNEARRRGVERIRAMVLDAFAPYDAEVWLFGSCASDEAKQASDVDVGVLPRAPVPQRVFADLVVDLEESTVPYDVDLVDLRHVTPEFRAEVQRTGIPWRR